MTEDEMVEWHHQIDGHEFAQTLGAGDGQGSLPCCSPLGHKELDRISNLLGFQIIKVDAVKVLHSICQQIWKNSSAVTGLEKVSFHSNPKERQCQRMLKLNSSHTLAM